MTRCKFECQMITEYGSTYEYSLSPVFGDVTENKVFWDNTPVGSLKLSIVKNRGKLFSVGKTYFIDISETE